MNTESGGQGWGWVGQSHVVLPDIKHALSADVDGGLKQNTGSSAVDENDTH